ncbi:RNA-directed RNA polymerase [ssRNA phage Gephyllon.4_21]|uniref:RNA-directed RNA polymerase n=2 Tax=Fiersviridae TaxID=2842319 RepID=A0A8S5KXN9_9VIRU|nr:RNA-directed RNA polymerase [ssRNA phage Gephyllon.4_21]QDH86782.1 MAG: RNA-dependent RNA polymerase [Leviviridae sp.]DAD50016.1 TPA_asm: RNA-directed RNA polymerase [ssRNA phage Gephyllon.4_21]
MKTKSSSVEQLKAARDFRAPQQLTDVTIDQFFSSLDTPRSLACYMLHKYGEHDQLLALDVKPDNYLNPGMFRDDYVATQFLSKASFLKTSFDRKSVAFKKFHEYEALCNRTNRRFENPTLDPQNNGASVWLLNATKRKISMILGDFDGEEFVDDANWGPGVSTLIKGYEVSGYNKFCAERGITRDLYSLIVDWFPVAYPSWSDHLSRTYGESWAVFQDGNNIVTVPKNSKTDRVIAIEPGINLWFQKAVGSMIRRRLRRFGIDLNDQSRNATLARQASIDSSLATVDFSSASDSIATSVVRELLPPRWFLLLDTLRSKRGMDENGSSLIWNKFSSMGNGFTFELESLIFYAAASAVNEYMSITSIISVYGDDVIIDSSSVHQYAEFCEFLGFRVNLQKSFYSGEFRESCGSHYFSGVDCKPIFLKEKLSNVETVFKLANNVRRLASRYGHNDFCDNRFGGCWRHLFSGVPEPLRFMVPLSAGDVGFVCNFDESSATRARYGIEGYYYQSLASLGVTRRGDGQGLILAQLRRLGPSLSSDIDGCCRPGPIRRSRLSPSALAYMFRPDIIESGESYTLRSRVRRTVVKALVAQWYNLGPWL